jgi:hypothetical protein
MFHQTVPPGSPPSEAADSVVVTVMQKRREDRDRREVLR